MLKYLEERELSRQKCLRWESQASERKRGRAKVRKRESEKVRERKQRRQREDGE